jgi:GxxExxY protein
LFYAVLAWVVKKKQRKTQRSQRMHRDHEPLPERTRQVAKGLVGAAIEVHKSLGPGLLESTYQVCLEHELTRRGLSIARQVALPVVYHAVKLDAGYRMDLVVGGAVVVEIKAIEALAPVHEAQLLTYLRLSGHRLGYPINFNVVMLTQGLKRMIL